MFSEKDFERLWFLYKTEGEPNGVSINSFCIGNNIPYTAFYDWFTPDFPVDGKTGEEQQYDGGGDGGGQQPDGQCLRLRYVLFSCVECGLCLRVEVAYQPPQFPVQRPVTDAQAVGVCFHLRRLFPLQGGQAVAEGVEFPGGWQHLYGLLAAEEACQPAFLLPHGADTCSPSGYFGQVVHQQAVCLVLPLHQLHDVPQMGFLVRQEGAERVYLCRAHVFAAERFHGLQQAVGAQELGMVMAVVRFVPADDALAQQGKPGDTTVGLTYVTAHLPDGFRAGFYLPDAFALMHQNGGHAADDRHHDNVACKNFKL